jgi:hypothetical protein
MTFSDKTQLQKIQTLILRLAEGDYAAREPVSDALNEFDAIINNLNMLGEELTNLSEKNRQMDLFFYQIAHDMKGPVYKVKALLEMGNKKLLDSGYSGPATEFFEMATTANLKLHDLIFGITELVKLNDPNLHLEAVDFQNMVLDTANIIRENYHCPDYDVTISSTLSGIFQSYPVLLSSIFHNLIENAWKYRNQNVKAKLEIRISDIDSGILIQCKDNGIGISPEFMPLIFDFFQRENPSIDGTGLGLYIVKNAIEKALKGKIEMTSRKGVGTTITIFLPHLILPTPSNQAIAI